MKWFIKIKRCFNVLLLVMLSLYITAQTNNIGHKIVYNVYDYGAIGDGIKIETDAINKAIDAASAAGGGTVVFPTGTFLSYSIHLKSNITLFIDQGATIEAAESSEGKGYDIAEPNQSDKFQDFGHSHWQNSLIWGIGLENISILGPGRIFGKGLTRETIKKAGIGNKAISLKLCRNVILRDFTILMGGHFAILATGIDNFTVDNLKMDTNRDGIDIDCCNNVRVSNCSINSPWDDGICLKASYGLGYAKATQNVTIVNCQVSGYDVGTFLKGTYERKEINRVPDKDGPTGRIKLGTESNGDFKNITISNCVFEFCRGLALETVDGSVLEDITISNITMRDIINSPIFLRLGSRMRAPAGTPVGALRRVLLSNIIVYNANPEYASIISGIPGHDIEDVRLSNINIYYKGGGTKEQSQYVTPENENKYPEPAMFGITPCYGFLIRHAKGIEFNNVNIRFLKDDMRPALLLDEIKDVTFDRVQLQNATGIPKYVIKNSSNVSFLHCKGIKDGEAR